MPRRWLRDNIDEFEDCLSQLQEIVTKYGDTYSLIIGGDFNEDLCSGDNSRRKRAYDSFCQIIDWLLDQQGKPIQPLMVQRLAQLTTSFTIRT